MGLLLPLSGVCFIGGTLTIVFAGSLASGPDVYYVLYIGAVITGIGWGLVETVVNPLCASLYPAEKAARLNTLHAWWPGGLIAGGLLGYGLSQTAATLANKAGADPDSRGGGGGLMHRCEIPADGARRVRRFLRT